MTDMKDENEYSIHYRQLVAKGYEFDTEYFNEYEDDKMVIECRRISNRTYILKVSAYLSFYGSLFISLLYSVADLLYHSCFI